MSDGNESLVAGGSGTSPRDGSSRLDTAKEEAADTTRTAADAAKSVGATAQDEAGSVVEEATDQLQDLYHQTRSELTDAASKQQERVAGGLRTVGDDLGSMASGAESSGVARQVVREAGQRVGRVAAWLDEREPGEVMDEVKSFARRQPGVFIGVAAIAGALAGRVTRALASPPEGTGGPSRPATRPDAPAAPPVPPSAVPEPTPLGDSVAGAAGSPITAVPGMGSATGGPMATDARPGAPDAVVPGMGSATGDTGLSDPARGEGSDDRPDTV